MSARDASGSAPQHSHPHNNTMSRNEKFWVDQVTVPHPPRGTTRGGERQGGGGYGAMTPHPPSVTTRPFRRLTPLRTRSVASGLQRPFRRLSSCRWLSHLQTGPHSCATPSDPCPTPLNPSQVEVKEGGCGEAGCPHPAPITHAPRVLSFKSCCLTPPAPKAPDKVLA